MKKTSLSVSAFAALILFATPAATLHAADGTWTGASGATWDTSATNWTGVSGTPWDGTNGPTNTAIFSATSGNAVISGTVTAGIVDNSPASGSFLIQGGNLTAPAFRQFNPLGDLTVSSSVIGTGGLAKGRSGTLVLSGNNSYTGDTAIRGGRLVLDYSGLSNTADPLSTGLVRLDSGALTLKGKTSGTTTETISTFNFQGTGLGFANSLTLDSNGGAGINLTITNFGTASVDNTQSNNLIDLSSNAANSLTITNVPATGATVVNGVLMATLGGSHRANLVVRDSVGYGFATRNGTTGAVGRLTTGITLTNVNTDSTTNFFMTSGSLTRIGNLDFQTLTLDSTGGAVTLSMNGTNLQSPNNGRGILATGANDINITGGGRIEGPGSAWVHNYSTGNLTFGLSTSNTSSTSLMFGGSGFTNWTGISTLKGINPDNIYAQGGTIFRVSTAQNWSGNTTAMGNATNSRMIVSSGAVLEVGADLNGATVGDLDLAVGAGSRLRFWGDSGLSAAGADRTVNFGGAGAEVTWGSNNFLTAPATNTSTDGTVDGNYIFKLSSARSDSTLTLQNGIALGTLQRVIEVANGSAATDAILSGNLTSTGGGITKIGTGTLVLSGTNTYTGATVVSAGTLLINGSQTSATGTVSVSANATLGGNGTLGGAVTIANNGILAPGTTGDATTTLTLNGTNLTISGIDSKINLDITGTAAGAFDRIAGINTFAQGGDITFTLTGSYVDGNSWNVFGFSGKSGTFNSVTLAGDYAGSLSWDGSNWTNTNIGGQSWQFDEAAGTLSVIPEPTTWALLAVSLTAVTVFRRRRRYS